MKRIHKKLLAAAAVLFISLLTLSTVYAKDARLVDNADLLTEEEEQKLVQKLDEISEKYQSEVVVLTVDSLEGRYVVSYADDYYDNHDYGYGSNYSGILLLIAMEDRDWAISTTGSAIRAFTDAGQRYMTDLFVPYLSDGEYYKAFDQFADLCEKFYHQASTGQPYDRNNMPRRPLTAEWVFLAVVIAVGLSGIITFSMKSQLKSVHAKGNASAYQTSQVQLTQQQDQFLYNKVTKVRQQSSSGGGGGGGGSSTHRSSSGRSHGGSHGKF